MDLNPAAVPTPYRRLTLLDLVWIVAAIAVGLGTWLFQARIREDSPTPVTGRDWVVLGSFLVSPLAWLVVAQSIRWSRPERLQPGSVACLAVVLTTMVHLVHGLAGISFATQRLRPARSFLGAVLEILVDSPWSIDPYMAAITLGWGALWWAGCWRGASSTPERLGRCVGFWFVGAYLAECVLTFWTSWGIYGLPRLTPLFSLVFGFLFLA